jgi:hypothetical protein
MSNLFTKSISNNLKLSFPIIKHHEKIFFNWLNSNSSLFFTHPSVVITNTNIGYGLKCDDHIKKGDKIIEVNSEIVYNVDAAVDIISHSMPDGFLNTIGQIVQAISPKSSFRHQNSMINSICLALVIQLNIKSNDPYCHFLNQSSYPIKVDGPPHPLCMNNTHLKYLQGTKVGKSINNRIKVYDYIANSLLGPNQSPLEFKWAISTILSRAISSENNKHPLSLVPIIDFANHSSENTNIEHRYDTMKQSFALYAIRDILPDEELCISYGKGRDSNSCLSIYGFIDEYLDGQNDIFSITLKGLNNNKLSKSVAFPLNIIRSMDRTGWKGLDNRLKDDINLPDMVIQSFQEAYNLSMLTTAREIAIQDNLNNNINEKNIEIIAIDIVVKSIDNSLNEFILSKNIDTSSIGTDLFINTLEILFKNEKINSETILDSNEWNIDHWKRICSISVSQELDAFLCLRQCCVTYKNALLIK